MAYFLLHKSGFPDFGRPRSPDRWHQVNFRVTLDKFWVWRFKWAMQGAGLPGGEVLQQGEKNVNLL